MTVVIKTVSVTCAVKNESDKHQKLGRLYSKNVPLQFWQMPLSVHSGNDVKMRAYSNKIMFQTLHTAIKFVKLCKMPFIIQPLIKDAQELFYSMLSA